MDVEESTNMYSYLIGNSGSKSRPGTGVRKSRARDAKARPSTAGATNRPSSRQASKRMGGGAPPTNDFHYAHGNAGERKDEEVAAVAGDWLRAARTRVMVTQAVRLMSSHITTLAATLS